MLEEIRISSLGVIESSTLHLGPGLTVITGETGAGKTMVVTALGLLLGGRADSGRVRTGARLARVEGIVATAELPEFASAVEDSGGEVEDDRVVLARTIAAEGRSRAFVGGASVPVSSLSAIAEPLVAVHGQSDQHRLLRVTAQRQALDRFGGPALQTIAADYADTHTQLLEVERELATLVSSARERVREADALRYGLSEISDVDPQIGEDTALAAEESRLGFADTLRVAAEQAREALSSDHGGPDALATVASARGQLDGVRDHDPQAAELADRLAELNYLLTDLAGDVASYASALDTDPARLAQVSERRSALLALTRKYGDTLEDVLGWAKEGAARLAILDDTDDTIEELTQRRDDLRRSLGELAASLSTARRDAAGRLAVAVTGELTALAMPHARLTIEVRHTAAEAESGLLVEGRWVRFSAHGIDDVEFGLAANQGTGSQPLAKGASGGELSRVMLALEVVLAATNPVPTFVFDEVDAGVGGKAAIEVGRRLARLAGDAQVIVVTHLPQVAAFAHHHVVVTKASDGSITTSGLTLVADNDRERELARMLAGLEESDTALAHAQELLAIARQD